MANDAMQLALVVGSTTAINGVYAVQNNRDPVPVLVANGVSFVGLSLVGGLAKRWDLAVALAWVFLIASIFMRGIPLIRSVNTVANSPAPKTLTKSNDTSKTNNPSGGGRGR